MSTFAEGWMSFKEKWNCREKGEKYGRKIFSERDQRSSISLQPFSNTLKWIKKNGKTAKARVNSLKLNNKSVSWAESFWFNDVCINIYFECCEFTEKWKRELLFIKSKKFYSFFMKRKGCMEKICSIQFAKKKTFPYIRNKKDLLTSYNFHHMKKEAKFIFSAWL